MKKILFAFTILSNIVFGQRDLKIEGIDPKDILLIGMPFDNLLINETKTAFPFEYNYGAYVYKAFNPKTGKVCGYLPHTFDNISHPYHIREKKLYSTGNYLVFVSEYAISVYNKTGKFIRDITRNYDAGNNRFLSLNFSDDFKQVCFLQEGDIFVATIDLATGKISNEKQITYVGNFVENYNGRVHLFKSNIILANSESGKMHWVNTISGEVKETAVESRFLADIFLNKANSNIRIPKWHKEMLVIFDGNSSDDPNRPLSFISAYDIETNNYWPIISNINNYLSFLYAFGNEHLSFFATLTDYEHKKNKIVEINIVGKILKEFSIPSTTKDYVIESDWSFQRILTYNQNLFIAKAPAFDKKEVFNLETGEIKNFIDFKFYIGQIGWVSDDLLIFSVLDESTRNVGDRSAREKYYYPTTEIGTYIFDAKNNILKKIFNYITGEGDFYSKVNSDGAVYFVANKNIWKYNYITGEKSKITTIASENLSIITSK